MKLSEVIAKIEDGSMDEFIGEAHGSPDIKITSEKALGKKIIKAVELNNPSKRVQIMSLFHDYEVVISHVTFMKAILSKKPVKVKHKLLGDIFNSYDDLENILWDLNEYFSGDKLNDILLNGKWYIED